MRCWLGRAVDIVKSPVFFGAGGVVGVAFPVFVECFEPEDGDVVFFAEFHELAVMAGLVGLGGSGAEFGCGGSPACLGDDHGLVRQDGADLEKVFDGEGECLVDGLAFPGWVGVDG